MNQTRNRTSRFNVYIGLFFIIGISAVVTKIFLGDSTKHIEGRYVSFEDPALLERKAGEDWARAGVSEIRLSPDGAFTATLYGLDNGPPGPLRVLVVHEINTGTILHSIPVKVGASTAVAFTPDGSAIVVKVDDSYQAWDRVTGEPLWKVERINSYLLQPHFLPGARSAFAIIALRSNPPVCEVHDVREQTMASHVLPIMDRTVVSLVCTADGKPLTALAIGKTKKPTEKDPKRTVQEMHVYSFAQGFKAPIMSIENPLFTLKDITFSDDGLLAGATASKGGGERVALHLWNPESGQERSTKILGKDVHWIRILKDETLLQLRETIHYQPDANGRKEETGRTLTVLDQKGNTLGSCSIDAEIYLKWPLLLPDGKNAVLCSSTGPPVLWTFKTD